MNDLPGWFRRLGHARVQTLRRMPKDLAGRYLSVCGVELEPQEIDEAVEKLAGTAELKSVTPIRQTDPLQRKFTIVAYLSGASLAQLARAYKVTRQTILERLEKEMPKDQRNTVRIRHKMEDWYFTGFKDLFYGIGVDNPDKLNSLDTLQLALALMDTPVDTKPDTVDVGYAGLTVPDKRLEGDLHVSE